MQKFLFLPLGPQELRRRQFHVVSDVPLVVISYLSRDLHVPLEWMKILIYELANRKVGYYAYNDIPNDYFLNMRAWLF